MMERIRQYSTATPAPSVAVNTPDTMPPITITISSRLGTASQMVFSTLWLWSMPVAFMPAFFAPMNATTMQHRPIRMPGM